MEKVVSVPHGVIKCTKQLKGFSAVLDAWLEECTRYTKGSEGDACWWYTERANVGILAAGAVRIGRVALEEFATKKGKVDGNTGSKVISSGRCDLWISGPRAGKTGYGLEAKQVWPALFPRPRIADQPFKQIDAAWKAAGACAGELHADAGLRLGAIFVVPWHSPKRQQDSAKAIKRIVGYLKDLRDLQALAVYFPTSEICRTSETSGYCYPGIALAVRVRQRAHRSKSVAR